MDDTLFDTDEKCKSAVASFRSLLQHPGWILLCKIADENIEVLRTQLEKGFEGEKESDIYRLRDKLSVIRDMMNQPKELIKKLELKDPVVPNADPFETVEDLEKRRKEQKD